MLALLMIAALFADGPAPEVVKGAHVYDWLIGDWDAEVIAHTPDGQTLRGPARVSFFWVLEGRAIQDVWIARPRTYGTTLRVYDPKEDVWRITWINPINGAEDHLVARKVGKDIVQEGVNAEGQRMRWSFRDITATSFHWYGEVSDDGGKTWRVRVEFLARRAPHEALWSGIGDDGFEHVQISGRVADGLIVRRGHRARYRIETDESSRVRSVSIDDLGSSRSLELRSDGQGHWTDASGAPLPALDGTIDVDLQASPFTSTLTIRRLALQQGQSSSTRVVSIDPVALTTKIVENRYTRTEPNVYRCERLDDGFAADLHVDGEGLLVEEPRAFRRAF